jgi:hypothetical protein
LVAEDHEVRVVSLGQNVVNSIEVDVENSSIACEEPLGLFAQQ